MRVDPQAVIHGLRSCCCHGVDGLVDGIVNVFVVMGVFVGVVMVVVVLLLLQPPANAPPLEINFRRGHFSKTKNL